MTIKENTVIKWEPEVKGGYIGCGGILKIALEKTFGDFPIQIDRNYGFGFEKIRAMALACAGKEENPYQLILKALDEFGSIILTVDEYNDGGCEKWQTNLMQTYILKNCIEKIIF